MIPLFLKRNTGMPDHAQRKAGMTGHDQWLLWTFFGATLFSVACNTIPENPNLQGPPYKAFSDKIQQKVDHTCNNLGITHFIVRNQTVFVRKEGTREEVALHHYRPMMPNGYYYCTKRSQHKSDLE